MKKKKESARERSHIQHQSPAPLGPLDPMITKSHLQLHAPPCPNCRKPMKVRILFPDVSSTKWTTAARNAEQRSCVLCHGRHEARFSSPGSLKKRAQSACDDLIDKGAIITGE